MCIRDSLKQGAGKKLHVGVVQKTCRPVWEPAGQKREPDVAVANMRYGADQITIFTQQARELPQGLLWGAQMLKYVGTKYDIKFSPGQCLSPVSYTHLTIVSESVTVLYDNDPTLKVFAALMMETSSPPLDVPLTLNVPVPASFI